MDKETIQHTFDTIHDYGDRDTIRVLYEYLSRMSKKGSSEDQRLYSSMMRKLEIKLALPIPKQNHIVTLLQGIKKIEGPISYQLLVPKKSFVELGQTPPVLLLLGDLHVRRTMCSSCDIRRGCLSLYKPSSFLKWMDEMSERNSIVTDLFIEEWIEPSRRHLPYDNPNQFESSLHDVIEATSQCTAQQKEICPFPHMRTHFVDVRGRKADNLLQEDLYQLTSTLEHPREDIVTWKQEIDSKYAPFTANHFLSIVQRIFQSEYPIDEFFDDPFFQRHSRTYHEWIQLPETVRNQLRRKCVEMYSLPKSHHKSFESILRHSNDFFEHIIEMNGPFEPEYELIQAYQGHIEDFEKVYPLIPFSMMLMDLYTISRCFKSFQPTSQLCIVYTGAAHTFNLLELVADYYDVKQSAQDASIQHATKCLHLGRKSKKNKKKNKKEK